MYKNHDDKLANAKKYHAEHRDSEHAYHKAHRAEQRLMCIEHYGGRCACCGEVHIEFLCIDHINGGGTKHREKIGKGDMIYRWLIKNQFPEGFRVLCSNCNQSYGHYGYCPHRSVV